LSISSKLSNKKTMSAKRTAGELRRRVVDYVAKLDVAALNKLTTNRCLDGVGVNKQSLENLEEFKDMAAHIIKAQQLLLGGDGAAAGAAATLGRDGAGAGAAAAQGGAGAGADGAALGTGNQAGGESDDADDDVPFARLAARKARIYNPQHFAKVETGDLRGVSGNATSPLSQHLIDGYTVCRFGFGRMSEQQLHSTQACYGPKAPLWEAENVPDYVASANPAPRVAPIAIVGAASASRKTMVTLVGKMEHRRGGTGTTCTGARSSLCRTSSTTSASSRACATTPSVSPRPST
jgi:hypothetical protein